jgi:hypothetical protein
MQAVTELLAAAARPVATAALAEPVTAFAGAEAFDAVAALDAATGAAACGPLDAVRGTLELLFAHQRADGALPARLAPARGLKARLAGWLGRPDAGVLAEAHHEGLAPAAMAIHAASAYVEATGDRQFLQDHDAGLARALAYVEATAGENLLDAVLAYRALKAMGELAVPRGEAVAAARFWARAASLRERANQRLWEPGRGRFAEPGDGRANLLAVAYGLAAPGQAQAILARAEDGLGLTAGPGYHALAAAHAGDWPRARKLLEQDHRLDFTPAEAGRWMAALAALNLPSARARA